MELSHFQSSEVLWEREAPLLSMLMKMKQKKIPSAIYIAPSLFAKNQMVSFQARSKAEFFLKKQNKTVRLKWRQEAQNS